MVKQRFSSNDLVNLALQMEEQGGEFYLLMAAKAAEESARLMFLKLAEEEKEHYQAFKKLGVQTEQVMECNDQAANFIQSILAQTGERSAEQKQKAVEDVKEALAYGIEGEKDSILLYQELYEMVTSPENKKVLSGILKAEKMHLVELREYLEELG